MKYEKPQFTKVQGKLPPITTNFAPPPVEQPPTFPEGDNDLLNLIKKNGTSQNGRLKK